MKNILRKHKHSMTVVGIITVIMMLTNCTRHDKCINCPPPPARAANTDTLISSRGTPTIKGQYGASDFGVWDGTIGSEWVSAPALTINAVVPNLGNGNFAGYVGNATNVTLQSMYDANYIYFLVQFNTDQKNVKSTPWYFDTTQTDMTKRWAQESTVPVMNSDGYTFRKPFQQDGFAFMFNVSDALFNAQSCYAVCHVNSAYGGTVTPAGGEMYTMGPTERTDIWRARMLQVASMNQANDCFLDDGSAQGQGSNLNILGLNNDVLFNDGDGLPNNMQTLTISGPGTFTTNSTEVVPLWVIPSGTYTNSAILAKDTSTGGVARKVIAVDSNGVLTLAGGGTIDPRSGIDYKQVGTNDGAKCPPGIIVGSYTSNRNDITCNAAYVGSSWRMLFKRKLKTNDLVNDVDFSSLGNQPFGIGAFFDGADNEHAITTGLILHFK
ncbi:MAG TPA: ethylbenzene dehydrogenase-related protein [Bacteroidia bacterium]